MDIVEREALQEARVYLLENVDIEHSILLDQLHAVKVLEEMDMERIKAEATNGRKIRCLCGILPTKGKTAFALFIDALASSNQDHVHQELVRNRKNIKMQIEKFEEQLRHWLPANYVESSDARMKMEDIVYHVRTDLYPGISERCIATVLMTVLPNILRSAKTEGTSTMLSRIESIVRNVKLKKTSDLESKRNELTDDAILETKQIKKDSGEKCEQKNTASDEQSEQKDTMKKYCSDNIDMLEASGISEEPKTADEASQQAISPPEEESFSLSSNQQLDLISSPAQLLCDGGARPKTSVKPCTLSSSFKTLEMEDWKIDHVCEWLETVEDLDESVIPLFRKAKIRGRMLKKLTADDMKDIFPLVPVGDRFEILENRSSFLPKLPETFEDGPTLEIADICPSFKDEQCGKLSADKTQPKFSLLLPSPTNQESTSTASNAEKQTERQKINVMPLEASDPTTELDSYCEEDVSKACDRLSAETPLKLPVEQSKVCDSLSAETPLKLTVEHFEGVSPLDNSPKQLLSPVAESHGSEIMTDSTQNQTDKLFKSDTETPCRKFESDASGICYRQGTSISCAEGRPTGQLNPFHKFVAVTSLVTKRERVKFVEEAVPFICACLNDRFNGTIYFGVSSQHNEGQTSGQIMGVLLPEQKTEFEEEFNKSLKKCFAEDQHDIVFHCVRPMHFVSVTESQCSEFSLKNNNNNNRNNYVVEIDVVPSYDLCAEEAFFARVPSFQRKKVSYDKGMVYRCFDGNVRTATDAEMQAFMKSKSRIAANRKLKEEQEIATKMENETVKDDLYLKLSDLLCRGDNSLPVDMYPVLVVNKPEEALYDEDMKNKLSFLCNVPFKATFDFDEESKVCNYLANVEQQSFKVISTPDDFNEAAQENIINPDRLKNLQEDVKSSKIQSWIFVNGHPSRKKLDPLLWKRQKQEGFKEAVRFYRREFPNGRALVVFLLLSDANTVLIQAAEELIASFQDQWMCICESPEVAETFSRELIHRECIDEKMWKENSIIGMSLEEISESVKRLHGLIKKGETSLITRSGAFVTLKESLKNELSDLDILGSDECHNYDPPSSFAKVKEEHFYKGGQVDWWNFWFDHVQTRTKLEDLKKVLESALRGGIDVDDQYVGRIALYHQAGAGGTTLAMNALWDLKKQYRCAVVNCISEPAQTAEQILKLRSYKDKMNPKPVLIMLDNLEEEKSNFLLAELEERAKHLARDGSSMRSRKSVICVLLNCLRRNKLPKEHKNKRVLLKQELDTKEKRWFERKHKEMEKDHELKCDPKMLLSFNIMKSNFDDRVIERMVQKLISDIESEKEKLLIKFVALLNAYDLQSQSIPTAAFDIMMTKHLWQPGLRYGRYARLQRWESHLSMASRVLLNDTSKVSIGFVHAIQITSPLLSKHIIKAINSRSEALSDMLLQFFNTKDIFSFHSIARDNLLKIVRDVLKHRAKNPRGLPETKFSPLIQTIVDKESVDRAGDVLEKALELTEDPFLAQQLARLYIHASNWEKAETFAKLATAKQSNSSYLWDTCGRVYLAELVEHYKTLVRTDKSLSLNDSKPFISCALKGIDVFKRVQEMSKTETKSMTNNSAGYFGELEIIQFLLDCMSYMNIFDTKMSMRRFFADNQYKIQEMIELDQDREDTCIILKNLSENANAAINKLEDEYIQLKEDHIDESKRIYHKMNEHKLEQLKEHLHPYFGEDTDNPPETASPEEQCHYRRRRVFRLGANSLLRIFDLKREMDGEMTLQKIKDIISRNVGAQFESVDDLRVLMSVNLALLQVSPKYLPKIMFEEMVSMSQRLYEKRANNSFIHLEVFLFYVMFNWPQEKLFVAKKASTTVHKERKISKPITHRMFTDALKNWRTAYFEKYPKQRDEGKPYRKKDTTIFFFANGSGMRSITSYESLKASKELELRGETFWNDPNVLRELKRFEGVLMDGGLEIQMTITYPSGNKDCIAVATSFPIRDRKMWNKMVYFVIGFSWLGPKAFNVSNEDPTLDLSYMTVDHSADWRNDPRRDTKQPPFNKEAPEVESHSQFQQKLANFTTQLRHIGHLKDRKHQGWHLSVEEERFIRDEGFLKNQRSHLIEQRARAIARNSLDY